MPNITQAHKGKLDEKKAKRKLLKESVKNAKDIESVKTAVLALLEDIENSAAT